MVDLIKNKLREEAGVALAGAGVYGLSESDRIVMDLLDTDATDKVFLLTDGRVFEAHRLLYHSA